MTSSSSSERPALTPDLTAEELRRWYWTKTELVRFARMLGIRGTGAKNLLTARISAALEGSEFPEQPAPRRSAEQLSGTISAATVIPAGQRCSQNVRAWFTAQVGPSFRFDAAMRSFFAESDGTRTMQDALAHWHATRERGETVIDDQFEYNRFTRAWHAEHVHGTREDLLAAWRDYRRRPVEERGRA